MRDILIASVIIAATVVCCAFFIIKLIRKNSESAGDIVSILCIAGAGVCIITAVIVLLLTRLRASQEKENLEHVIDHLNAMAVLWDTNFSYVRVNNSLVRITGYSEEELRDPANLKKDTPCGRFQRKSSGHSKQQGRGILLQDKGRLCCVHRLEHFHRFKDSYP